MIDYQEKKISESALWVWYINTQAEVFRINKLYFSKKKPKKVIYLKPYLKGGRLQVKYNGIEKRLANLLVESFSTKFHNMKHKYVVEFKDGDPLNVSMENIRVYSYSLHGKRTGYKNSKSKPVRVRKKYSRTYEDYPSVRSAAKELHVSFQTLFDYLNPSKKPKNSILSEYKINYL